MAESDQQQQNLRRPQAGDGPIKYGDVFKMSGDMAGQPISPRDAAAMQSAENSAFGKTIKGGPASLMLSAAAMNVEAGLVPPGDAAAAQPATAQELGAVNTLTDDKPATTRDAELVSAAELRGGPEGAIKQTTTPGGVAEAVTTAARINEAEK